MKTFVYCGFFILLSIITISNADDAQCAFQEGDQTRRVQSDFTLQLYNKINAANPNKNVVFSPVSILLALSLLEAGSSGQTQTDLRNHLAPLGSEGNVSLLYQSLQHQLKIQEDDNTNTARSRQKRKRGGSNRETSLRRRLPMQEATKATLTVANALYYKKDLELKPEYLSTVKQCFETEIAALDFGQTETARNTINQWISNKTNEKIPELIKSGVLTTDTIAVLANAIYLKASWQGRLSLSNDLIDFHPAGQGNPVQKVKFMTRQAKYNYAEDADFQLVELPYANAPLSMYIIKAKAPNTSIQALESKVTSDRLMPLADSRTMRNVFLKLPPFEIRLPTKLTDILKQIGLGNMFTDTADFSRMDPSNRIKVSHVVHEAYIKVNENGTEAAAATAVIMAGSRASGQTRPETPVQFIVDYPFLFSILHQPTKSTLFYGKVSTIKTD